MVSPNGKPLPIRQPPPKAAQSSINGNGGSQWLIYEGIIRQHYGGGTARVGVGNKARGTVSVGQFDRGVHNGAIWPADGRFELQIRRFSESTLRFGVRFEFGALAGLRTRRPRVFAGARSHLMFERLPFGMDAFGDFLNF